MERQEDAVMRRHGPHLLNLIERTVEVSQAKPRGYMERMVVAHQVHRRRDCRSWRLL